MIDDEKLSAYLDGELPEAEARSLARALEDDPDSRARLEDLRTAKTAVESIDVSLERADVDRLDAAILTSVESTDDETTGAPALASGVPDSPPSSHRRQSPRKRGRAPAPYFAAAAIVAVILIAGIGLLATSLTGPDTEDALTTDDTQTVDEGTVQPENDSDLGTERAPADAPESFGTGSDADTPQLFVSDIRLTTTAELSGLLESAAPVTLTREAANEDLGARARAVGFENVRACLETTAPPFTPTTVYTGRWLASPAFFVAGSTTGTGAADQVLVLDAEQCRELARSG